MVARVLQVFLVLLCITALVGCEGDTGPAGPQGPVGPPGPSTILGYGDIDEIGPTVLSSGPSGTTVSVVKNGTGDYTVTLTGTFPSTTGVLIVSPSSDGDPFDDCFVTGTITSWSTTQIDLWIRYFCHNIGTYVDEEFSFVVLGE
ncbi:MAG: hypothetical protein JSW58_03620 [Candidatus Latescibacterota bacterium]|nr:MAG: hypothetical protein JSW58_03620 [Candidatus Latescibacterota bacterium]